MRSSPPKADSPFRSEIKGGTKNAKSALGQQGEELVRRYFEHLGCRIIGMNVRLGPKEIDLIVRDGTEIVFVEVKTRRSNFFGEPEEAVTYKKLRLLEQAVALYIRNNPQTKKIRLDVVSLLWSSNKAKPILSHFKNVEGVSGMAF